MKQTKQYYEQEDEKLRGFVAPIREALQNIPGAKHYLATLKSDLVKEKVDEDFLTLVEDVKRAGDLKFKIARIGNTPQKLTRKEYVEMVRFEKLSKFLSNVVEAILKNDYEYFLKLHNAVEYEFTAKKSWKVVYKKWIFLSENFGRKPTCMELLEQVTSSGLKMDRRTLLDICKRYELLLTKGRTGRPKKLGSCNK